MKTLIRNLTVLVLSLSMAGFAMAGGPITYSCSAYNTNSDENGGDPWIPANACAQYYAYVSGSASAYVRIYGNVDESVDETIYSGSISGESDTTAEGTLSVRVGCQTSYGGSAGASVTINW